ncbi:MAG TPA: hypothetical protein VGM94_17470 [Galbitalea sp.]
MAELNIDISALSGDSDADQKRCLRLVLAALEDDFVQLAEIVREVHDDPRGFDRAAWELLVALSVGLARQWALENGPEAAAAGIRATLLSAAAENGENDAR